MRRRIKILLAMLALALALFLTGRFVAKPFIVIGESMSPMLHSWDFCIMQRVYHYQPHRGDIVMFRTADNPPIHFVKRVIALPGETVAVSKGIIQLNGTPLTEPYETVKSDWSLAPTNVPPDRIFVVGDNRGGAGTESWHGFVATRLVVGKFIWLWRWKK